MCVCKTDSPREERMRFDQNTNLAHTSDLDGDQRIQFGKSLTAVSQRTESDLCGNKWMHCYSAASKQPVHIRIKGPKMIYPYRRVRENHH